LIGVERAAGIRVLEKACDDEEDGSDVSKK
jgi:hypothetical protein